MVLKPTSHFLVVFPVCFLALSFCYSPKFPRTQCFFYDKPPRTGSTTIARALEACLLQKGYTSIHTPIAEIERSEVVTNMLSMVGRKFSAVIKHVEVSDEDVELLQNNCSRLFYLSSARPMRQRIASAAKYSIVKRHGNATLSKEQFERALQRAEKDGYTESELEAYPFTGSLRIHPDYVIRTKSLSRDLNNLLQSLGCRVEYVWLNVHVTDNDNKNKEEIMNIVRLNGTDERYTELLRVAKKRNEHGLRKAKNF